MPQAEGVSPDLNLFPSDFLLFKSESTYSYFKASKGFCLAAVHVCQLTVRIAMINAITPDTTNIHQLNSMRYAKLLSQLQVLYDYSI